MIYLASPYSHPDPQVREERYQRALEALRYLHMRQYHAFSPIVHNHPMVKLAAGMGVGWESWHVFDLWFVDRCDAMIVFEIAGWEVSVGVEAEMERARERNIPIAHWSGDGEELERRMREIGVKPLGKSDG
jgi:hypothetical protein